MARQEVFSLNTGETEELADLKLSQGTSPVAINGKRFQGLPGQIATRRERASQLVRNANSNLHGLQSNGRISTSIANLKDIASLQNRPVVAVAWAISGFNEE